MTTRTDPFSRVDFATFAHLLSSGCLTVKGQVWQYLALLTRFMQENTIPIAISDLAKELSIGSGKVLKALKELSAQGSVKVLEEARGSNNRTYLRIQVSPVEKTENFAYLRGKSFAEVRAEFESISSKMKCSEIKPVCPIGQTDSSQFAQTDQLDPSSLPKRTNCPLYSREEKKEENTPCASSAAALPAAPSGLMESKEGEQETGTPGGGREPEGILSQGEAPNIEHDDEVAHSSSARSINAMRNIAPEESPLPNRPRRSLGLPRSPFARRSQVPAAVPQTPRAARPPRAMPAALPTALRVISSSALAYDPLEDFDMTDPKNRKDEKRSRWKGMQGDLLGKIGSAAGATPNDAQAAAQRLALEAVAAKRAAAAAKRAQAPKAALSVTAAKDDSVPLALARQAGGPKRLHEAFVEAMGEAGFVAKGFNGEAGGMWKNLLKDVSLEEAIDFVGWIVAHWRTNVQPAKQFWKYRESQPKIGVIVSSDDGAELLALYRKHGKKAATVGQTEQGIVVPQATERPSSDDALEESFKILGLKK